MGAEWIIGVILSVCASTFSCIGVNTQKLVHTRVHNDPDTDMTSVPLWWLGMALIMAGSCCDLVSYGFADISLLAPLGSLTMLTNLLVAPLMVQSEKLTQWDLLCTAIIFTGVLISIAFGSKSSTNYTLDDLLKLYDQDLVFALAGLYFIVAVFVRFLFLRFTKRQESMLSQATEKVKAANVDDNNSLNSPKGTHVVAPSLERANSERIDGLIIEELANEAASADLGLSKETVTLITEVFEEEEQQADYKLLRFLLPTTAGMFGSCSALCGKSLAEIATAVLDGDYRLLQQWSVYVILLSMVFFLVMQVRILNAGLSIAPALYIVPIYQVMWSVANISIGMVYFKDYQHLYGSSIYMFPVGICVIFAGMYLLSHPPDKTKDDEPVVAPTAVEDVPTTKLLAAEVKAPTDEEAVAPIPSIRKRRRKRRKQSVLISGGLRSSLIFDAFKNTSSNAEAAPRSVKAQRRSLIIKNNSRGLLATPKARGLLSDDMMAIKEEESEDNEDATRESSLVVDDEF